MVTILVDEYDRGIAHYKALGFGLVEDTVLDNDKRWVVMVAAEGSRILLAKATSDEQIAAIGNQTGSRVGFFMETDDFAGARASMIAAGVVFEESARAESYGIVAVFCDGYGNRWDLIEPHEANARCLNS